MQYSIQQRVYAILYAIICYSESK